MLSAHARLSRLGADRDLDAAAEETNARGASALCLTHPTWIVSLLRRWGAGRAVPRGMDRRARRGASAPARWLADFRDVEARGCCQPGGSQAPAALRRSRGLDR